MLTTTVNDGKTYGNEALSPEGRHLSLEREAHKYLDTILLRIRTILQFYRDHGEDEKPREKAAMLPYLKKFLLDLENQIGYFRNSIPEVRKSKVLDYFKGKAEILRVRISKLEEELKAVQTRKGDLLSELQHLKDAIKQRTSHGELMKYLDKQEANAHKR